MNDRMWKPATSEPAPARATETTANAVGATLSQDQFDAFVKGSMAVGPMFEADPDKFAAEARVRQMLGRAGITVSVSA